MESVSRRSSRHHRVDEGFIELLHEDFGVEVWELQAAFVGVPSVPKKEAIALCCWAEYKTDDLKERGEMLRRWARKHGKGSYHPNILAGPTDEEDY
jgi:hypothetical protein